MNAKPFDTSDAARLAADPSLRESWAEEIERKADIAAAKALGEL